MDNNIYKRITYPNCRIFPGQTPPTNNFNCGLTQTRNQSGGSSAWMHSSNDVYIRPDRLTEWSLKHIENSPMFHPLEYSNAPLGTPTTGLYPVGIYYMNQVMQRQCAGFGKCTQPCLNQRSLEYPSRREQLIANLKKAMY